MALPDIRLPVLPEKTPRQRTCCECPHSKRRWQPAREERMGYPGFLVCKLTGEMPVPEWRYAAYTKPPDPPKWCPL